MYIAPKSAALREGFKSVLDSFTYYNKSDGKATVEGKVVANFMWFWLRFVGCNRYCYYCSI